MPGSLVQEVKRLTVEEEPKEKLVESEASETEAAAAGAAEEAAAGEGGGAAAAAAAKKKKKKKKKKADGADGVRSLGFVPAQDNSTVRRLGSWPEVKPSLQTSPPTKSMRELFPNGDFPKGEVQLYASAPRDAEARHDERLAAVDIEGLREAAECHRQVRRYAQSLLRPGLSLTELCEKLEAMTMKLIDAKGIERGKGFPTGCSLNECAAHYTPNPGEDRILGAGKSVPIVKCGQHSQGESNRMEEGELYAIETFASTGRGHVTEEGGCSHYMKNFEAGFVPLRLKTTKELLKLIDEHFGTLAFCRRWLEAAGAPQHQMALQQLTKAGVVVPYPPLSDITGSFTSQMEHTVYIGATSKEILSRGPDF